MKVTDLEQGGAYAIKGFNFQTAMGALIAVFNYSEQDFKMIVEGKEDLEVYKAGIYTYIQVKSSPLKTKDLIKAPKDKKSGERRLAILYKLLSKGKTKDRYKLIVSDKFPEKDFLQKFALSTSNQILDKAYQPKPETIREIQQHMQNEGIPLPIEILQQLFLYRAPFQTDLETASRYICGVMNELKILTDNEYGHNAFNEIIRIIYQKSEHTESGNIEKKTIYASDLKRIFHTSNRPFLENKIIEELFPGQVFKQDKIKKHILKIPLTYQYHKDNIKKLLGPLKTPDSIKDTDFINKVMKQLIHYAVSDDIKYAIIIDLMLDEYEESL